LFTLFVGVFVLDDAGRAGRVGVAVVLVEERDRLKGLVLCLSVLNLGVVVEVEFEDKVGVGVVVRVGVVVDNLVDGLVVDVVFSIFLLFLINSLDRLIKSSVFKYDKSLEGKYDGSSK
jgi:hypothetical protein